jgi:hypothetical protein
MTRANRSAAIGGATRGCLIWSAPLGSQSVQRAASLRAFVQTRYGKIALVALTIATLSASFLYLGPYFAIPTFLLFGLAVPIYLGWKIPRELAILGIVAILVSGPIVNYGLTAQAMIPSTAASTGTDSTNTSNGQPVLTNATEGPYNAPGGTNFTFSVDLYANRLPDSYVPDLLAIFVSTCPGATGPSSPFCGGGYPFYTVNQSVANDTTSPTAVAFHLALPGPNIWWWQMGLLADRSVLNTTSNSTSTNYTWIFLDIDNAYGAVQGPVTGTWLSTYVLVLPQTVLSVLFYPGLVFYAALLVYLYLKNREARRKAARAGAGSGTIPPTTGAQPSAGPPGAGTAIGVPSGPRRPEAACPKCGAVVYPKETQCWKCGAPIVGGGSTPLASGPG